MIIAIDGPAGSGKSTLALRLAQRLGCTLLDTGAIYRALALLARRSGADWGDGPALARLASSLRVSFSLEGDVNRVFVEGEDLSDAIRTPEISRGSSEVSRHPEVREALLALQRELAAAGSLVTEGRDTTTVVFPEAQVKVFLLADARVRAERRQRQLAAAGHVVELEEVLAAEEARDRSDAERAVAPLRQAPDAVVLDTTRLSVEEAIQRVLALCSPFDSPGVGR
ncbi:MAG: (d)CMP kinase [Deltaproteobacteria bacterium]|nr:(d)CMP kinase [Deltaproteobacteria bacterium]